MVCKLVDHLVPVRQHIILCHYQPSPVQSKPSAWTVSEETFLCLTLIAIPKTSTDAAIVFPAWSSSLWAAALSVRQPSPGVAAPLQLGGPIPMAQPWHSPLADFYHADLCTCSHIALSSGLCRAPFAPCMLCGHTAVFKMDCACCESHCYSGKFLTVVCLWGKQDLELL